MPDKTSDSDLDAALSAYLAGRVSATDVVEPCALALRASETRLPDEALVRERLAKLKQCAHLIGCLAAEAAGYSVGVRMTPSQAFRHYIPLASVLGELTDGRTRRLVAVAGAPGSGKTVLARQLEIFVNTLAQREAFCIALGLDGFHCPNAVLDRTWGATPQGERVPLRRLKGCESSFDAPKAIAALRRLRDEPDRTHAFPRYDRKLHEPVEEGIAVSSETAVVLVEGNYVLLNDGRWRGMADLFDLRLYVEAPSDERRRGLIARHMRGGRSRPDAVRHYELVDVANAGVVEASRPLADVVVQKTSDHAIESIR